MDDIGMIDYLINIYPSYRETRRLKTQTKLLELVKTEEDENDFVELQNILTLSDNVYEHILETLAYIHEESFNENLEDELAGLRKKLEGNWPKQEDFVEPYTKAFAKTLEKHPLIKEYLNITIIGIDNKIPKAIDKFTEIIIKDKECYNEIVELYRNGK